MDHLSERLKNLLNQVEKLNLTFEELIGKNDDLELKNKNLRQTLSLREEKIKALNEEYKDWNKCLGTGSFSLSHEEKLNRDYYRGRFASINSKGDYIYNWEDKPL